MYKYDEYDHAMVAARVAEFSDQVKRRLSGELTEEEFKPLRLINRLDLQLHPQQAPPQGQGAACQADVKPDRLQKAPDPLDTP